ncbi:MAG: SH3 domain-containing protein [Actinobacteria bacterium]|nr:SH3 domain-containing protein [Actinomycetota bacterium]
MKQALTATRAALTWLVLTACLVTAGVLDAVPAQAAVKTYTANTSVNVRSGPSTSKTILTQLATGDSVVAAGKVSGDWLPITYDNTTAYVWAEYLDVNTNPASVVVTGPSGRKSAARNVNVRSSASLDADITAILPKATAIKVTGLASGSFTQVNVDAKTQWIRTEFLSSATDTTPEVVASFTTIADLALRSTASVAATSQLVVPKVSTLGTTGLHSGSYSQVVYKSKVGWVITGYLQAVAGTPDDLELPIRTDTLYAKSDGVVIRAKADAKSTQLATIDTDGALRSTGTPQNSFTQVIWNGGTAWVASADLSTKKSTIDLGSDSLNKLEPYAKAAVVEVRANFPEIKTIYGWRSGSAYSSDHPNGRATDNMIPSYKSNKALGDKLAQWVIDNGERLHVTYVIWRQRNYRISRGYWVKMADRGGDTANHMDHVHISFEPS